MSQQGYLTFYSDRPLDDPKRLLRDTLCLYEASDVSMVLRWPESASRWKEFRLRRGRPFQPIVIVESTPGKERLNTPTNMEAAVEFYKDRYTVLVESSSSPHVYNMEELLQRRIPAEVRGDFIPCGPVVTVGSHDIFECAEHDEGHLFARATFSFHLWGPGTPNDWNRYRELVFEVPEVQQLQADLEAIAGPLDRCVYWNV